MLLQFSAGDRPTCSKRPSLTCSGEGEQVVRDELGVAAVGRSQGLPQDGLQTSEEGHDVQQVEGEAAEERQQVAGGADRCRRRVRHHVSIHGAVERRCKCSTHTESMHSSRSFCSCWLSGLTCSPEGHVAIGAGDPDV